MPSSKTIVGLPLPPSASLSAPSSREQRHESMTEAFQRIELTLDLSGKCHDHSPGFIESPLITPKNPPPLCNFNDVQIIEPEECEQDENEFEDANEFEAQVVMYIHIQYTCM